jgi:hypothetical protein
MRGDGGETAQSAGSALELAEWLRRRLPQFGVSPQTVSPLLPGSRRCPRRAGVGGFGARISAGKVGKPVRWWGGSERAFAADAMPPCSSPCSPHSLPCFPQLPVPGPAACEELPPGPAQEGRHPDEGAPGGHMHHGAAHAHGGASALQQGGRFKARLLACAGAETFCCRSDPACLRWLNVLQQQNRC